MKAKAILSTVAVGLGISLTSALAIPVNITLSGSPPFSGSSAVVANNVSPSNFGDDTVFNWLTADVSAWNTINGTSYAAPTRNADGTALLKVTTSSGPDSITLALGSYDYVFLHWGGKVVAGAKPTTSATTPAAAINSLLLLEVILLLVASRFIHSMVQPGPQFQTAAPRLHFWAWLLVALDSSAADSPSDS